MGDGFYCLAPLQDRGTVRLCENRTVCRYESTDFKVRAVWAAAGAVTLAGLTADFVAALVRLDALVELVGLG